MRRNTMRGLLRFSRSVDKFNTRLGQIMAWCVLIAILVSAVNATIRKIFNVSSNSWLELQWVLFGIVFLLCSSWTLLSNEHIRIDIVNNLLPKRARDWIDVIGHLFFLMPRPNHSCGVGLAVFLALLDAKRAVNERRRIARVPSQISHSFCLHLAPNPGEFRAHQAHRDHVGRTGGHRLWRWASCRCRG